MQNGHQTGQAKSLAARLTRCYAQAAILIYKAVGA